MKEEMKIDCGDSMEYSKGINEVHPAYLAADNYECGCGYNVEVCELDEDEYGWLVLIRCVNYGSCDAKDSSRWIGVEK